LVGLRSVLRLINMVLQYHEGMTLCPELGIDYTRRDAALAAIRRYAIPVTFFTHPGHAR
jgi:hypothetical protein